MGSRSIKIKKGGNKIGVTLMVALTYNANRRNEMLDVQGLISELGVPIAMSLAMMWGCFYLIKYITGQHTVMMNTKFEYLTGILVKLIDQQKLMQLNLKEWSSNTETLVDFLKDERDREQQRLIEQAKSRCTYYQHPGEKEK